MFEFILHPSYQTWIESLWSCGRYYQVTWREPSWLRNTSPPGLRCVILRMLPICEITKKVIIQLKRRVSWDLFHIGLLRAWQVLIDQSKEVGTMEAACGADNTPLTSLEEFISKKISDEIFTSVEELINLSRNRIKVMVTHEILAKYFRRQIYDT